MARRTPRALLLCASALAACAAAGCGDDSGDDLPPAPDATPADAPPPDAQLPDATPVVDGVGTIAGTFKAGYKDGPRNAALFDNPVNLAVGVEGEMYVADFNNSYVRKITPGGLVTTIVDDPRFTRPFGLLVAAGGTKLYVQTDRSSTGANTGGFWVVDLATNALTHLGDDVGRPRGLAELSDGRLVQARYLQHDLRIYDPASGETTLLAGGTGQPGYLDDVAAQARFDQPYDIVVLAGDVMLVSDLGNNRIRRVQLSGVVETFAGTGSPTDFDGPAILAAFNGPQGLTITDAGIIYVSSINGYTIRVIAGGMVGTLAGDGTAGFMDALDLRQARFFGLEGLDTARDGSYLYIADGDRGESQPYHRIRRVTLPQP